MKYDFTSIMDRRGKDALAIDGIGADKVWGNEPDAPGDGFDFIPMWVADMNFPTCPSVTGAIMDRLAHPAFGYFRPSEEYYASIIRWQEEHFGATGLKKEHIGYENGVHGCVTSAVNVLSQPGDKILIHSPFYLGFTSDIEGLGRKSVFSPLKKDEEGIWRMDYEDMDRKLKENHIHLAIFCSPHNPCGRVWERWELEKAMEVYQANDCYVISDEIWADLTFSGHRHIPSPEISRWARDHVIAVYAPSKTFNIAGMIGSFHVIYSDYLRDRITRYGNATHYNEMNVLSMHALIGAYKPEGSQWLEELRTVLEENVRYAVDFIRENFHGVDVSMPQGTYMIFLDCTKYCEEAGITIDQLLKAGWDVGVGWQDGRPFGGPCHIRMNLASPASRIREAFARLGQNVFLP